MVDYVREIEYDEEPDYHLMKVRYDEMVVD